MVELEKAKKNSKTMAGDNCSEEVFAWVLDALAEDDTADRMDKSEECKLSGYGFMNERL